jgi:hypothetical protein
MSKAACCKALVFKASINGTLSGRSYGVTFHHRRPL